MLKFRPERDLRNWVTGAEIGTDRRESENDEKKNRKGDKTETERES